MRGPFKVAQWGFRLLVAATVVIGSAHGAWATTINFDDIVPLNCGDVSIDVIPPVYEGFTWGASMAVECDSDFMTNSGNTYSAPSDANAVYNTFGDPLEVITRASQFQFDGAMFSGWTIDNKVDLTWTATTVTVQGFLGATLVGSQTLTLGGIDESPALGYLPMSGIAGAIDTLKISSDNFWLMDDFQYEDVDQGGPGPEPSPVPEPASLLLLGSGVAGMLARRRLKGARDSAAGDSQRD